MTNDTTTLNGSLLEMKDQLISELEDKGVTASYDPATGLLGLIEKIGDIHSYKIDFAESSYTATGGSATISCTLYEDYVLKSGATVTFTGSDSSSYTGITNSSGVATVTVTGISSNTTFTCSYGKVSDTCTVTVPANYTLQFSQNTYLSGSVRVTLMDNGVAMSGKTVTFAWTDMGVPQSQTATTNSNGVATTNIYPLDSEVTVTASYQGATATCKVIGEPL